MMEGDEDGDDVAAAVVVATVKTVCASLGLTSEIGEEPWCWWCW